MAAMTTLNKNEVRDILDERRREWNELDEYEALKSPVDAEHFHRLVGSIHSINNRPGKLKVRFKNPVPSSLTELGDPYKYTIEVSSNNVATRSRADMPRKDLVTMQQISIIIWAIHTGRI